MKICCRPELSLNGKWDGRLNGYDDEVDDGEGGAKAIQMG